jgi:hypothetical protein
VKAESKDQADLAQTIIRENRLGLRVGEGMAVILRLKEKQIETLLWLV